MPKTADATMMPYRAFAHVSSDTLYTPDKCKEDEKFEDGTCKPAVEKYGASGVFILRSIRTATIAYVLTAKHLCDHKDAKPDLGTALAHRFIIRDYYGQPHRGTALFSSNTYDACIIAVEDVGADVEMSAVASQAPQQGERVFNLAAPHSIFYKKMVLTFEGFYSGDIESRSVFTIPAGPGSSGSPVFNSRGEIVSMLWSVPMEEIKRGDEIIQSQLLENLAFGLQFANIREMFQSLQTYDDLFGTTLLKPKSDLSTKSER